MIDLSRHVKQVKVDVNAHVVSIGGGALWSDVDKATVPHGLATVGGTVNHVRSMPSPPWSQAHRADKDVRLGSVGACGSPIHASARGSLTTNCPCSLLLGGGYGYLIGLHGLAIDNLVQATVVLADGRIVTASETEYTDVGVPALGLRDEDGNC